MARISSYPQDGSLSGEDRLLGSSYEGEGQNGAIYKTRTYKLDELGDFISSYVGDVNINDSEVFNSLSQTVTSNTNAIATANQSITTITNELLAQSTFQTNLAASFGTYDEFGNLISFSEATANQILQVTTSDRYANAQFVTNLAASVGTYDANGNLVTMGQAFADQVLSATASDRFATSTFATNLAASFGTYNPDGSIATFSEATANQILQASTASDFANAQFVTNLVSNFGTFDENGNILTVSDSYANQILQTANTAEFAQASFVTNLASSFGTYNQDGSIATFSQSFANNVLSTANTSEFAQASFVTNLATSFGTYDASGNLLTISSSFADDVLSTANTAELAEASKLTALGTSFGTLNPDGSIATLSEAFANQVLTTTTSEKYAESSFVTNLGASIGSLNPDGTLAFDINSSYSQGIKNYIENNSAVAESIETLQTIYSTIPVTIRQPDEPAILDIFNDLIYPLGSIWVDTDDSNALYVLIEDAGAPSGYSWSPTTSEALGDLILSNSQLQQEVNILSTDVSTEATKLDKLRSKFGYFDINTGEFIVDNSSEVIASLRTYADAQSTSAKKVDGINSVFNMVDANGNVIKNQAAFNQEITTYVDANSATAQTVTGLVADVGDNAAAITAEQEARATADSANASYSFNVASSIGSVDANGNIIAVSEAFANSIINTETTSSYATASQIDALSARVGDTEADIAVQQSVTATLEGFAESRYSIQATSGGVVTGMSILSQQGATQNISQIIFNTEDFKIQNGSGVDQFTINTTTGKAEFSGHLQAATGTFTGTLQAGGVTITNDTITLTQLPGLDFSSNILFNNSSGSQVGEIKVIDIGSAPVMYITSGNGLALDTNTSSYNLSNSFMANGNGVATSTAQIRDFLTVRLQETSGNSVYLDSAGVYLATSNGTFFWVQDNVISCGNATADVIFNVNGASISGGGPTTDTNYYLSNITRSGNTLTFVVSGAANQTYTFGANAFNSTTIPTNNNQLTNGAGYVTASTSSLSNYYTKSESNSRYYTKSQVNSSFAPTNTSVTFSGSLTATDFILSSDASLKENIKDYAVKPINISYKSYNLIGDDQERVGVIAQELEVEHPEFVRENEEGIKSVSYIDMLVAKVAELEARIKELEHGGRK